jgi:hypothetical protein
MNYAINREQWRQQRRKQAQNERIAAVILLYAIIAGVILALWWSQNPDAQYTVAMALHRLAAGGFR